MTVGFLETGKGALERRFYYRLEKWMCMKRRSLRAFLIVGGID
jgi:hypothetical protein